MPTFSKHEVNESELGKINTFLETLKLNKIEQNETFVGDKCFYNGSEAEKVPDDAELTLVDALIGYLGSLGIVATFNKGEQIAENKINTAIDQIANVKKSLFELRSFNKPPALCKFTMECVLKLLQINFTDSWEASRKLLLSANGFIKKLEESERSSLSESLIEEVTRKYLNEPDFKPEKLRFVSRACETLCRWCHVFVAEQKQKNLVAVLEGNSEDKKTDKRKATTQRFIFEESLATNACEGEFAVVLDKVQRVQAKIENKNSEFDSNLLSLVDICKLFTNLQLSTKGIDAFSSWKMFPNVTYANLSDNNLQMVPHIPDHLLALNLSSNRFADIHDLSTSSLIFLSLAYNPLEKLPAFPKTLEHLDLSFTNISSFEKVVASCNDHRLPNLKTLNLQGSPLSLHPLYRTYLLSSLPQIQRIDEEIRKPDDAILENFNQRLNLQIKISEFAGLDEPDFEILETEENLVHKHFYQLQFKLPSLDTQLGEKNEWVAKGSLVHELTTNFDISAEWRDAILCAGFDFYIVGMHEVYESTEAEEMKPARTESKLLGVGKLRPESTIDSNVLKFEKELELFHAADCSVDSAWIVGDDCESSGLSFQILFDISCVQTEEITPAEAE